MNPVPANENAGSSAQKPGPSAALLTIINSAAASAMDKPDQLFKKLSERIESQGGSWSSAEDPNMEAKVRQYVTQEEWAMYCAMSVIMDCDNGDWWAKAQCWRTAVAAQLEQAGLTAWARAFAHIERLRPLDNALHGWDPILGDWSVSARVAFGEEVSQEEITEAEERADPWDEDYTPLEYPQLLEEAKNRKIGTDL
jgi:hypothetical protein